MNTITMSNEDKNSIAIGTEVIATQDGFSYQAGDVLIITEQDYDYFPMVQHKYPLQRKSACVGYIYVMDFEVLDLSDVAPTTTAVKLLPGERPKHGVVYTVIEGSMTYLEGWEVVLYDDDGTSNPFFVRVNGLPMLGFERASITLSNLTYEPEQTATPTPIQSDEQIKRSLPVGTRVRLTSCLRGYFEGLRVGDEGHIAEQDGTNMPRLWLYRLKELYYVHIEDFEAIPVTSPAKVTQDNLAFGQVYKLLDDTAAAANPGDLLVLKRNDGSNCPFFYNLSTPTDMTCAWLHCLVAVNVIESMESKELTS